MNVLVTGGSRGIGFVIAEHLARHGWSVTITGTNDRTLNEALDKLPVVESKQIHHAWVLDMSDVEAVEHAKGAPVPLGSYIALVNNAGVGEFGPLEDQSTASIYKSLTVNLQSAIVLSQVVVRAMLKEELDRPRHLIYITSAVALRGYPMAAVYTATKAGLEGFVSSLARELGPKKIIASSVAPGVVQTDMSRDVAEAFLSQNALEGYVPAGEVAKAVEFLLESNSITGRSIVVDKGVTL